MEAANPKMGAFEKALPSPAYPAPTYQYIINGPTVHHKWNEKKNRNQEGLHNLTLRQWLSLLLHQQYLYHAVAYHAKARFILRLDVVRGEQARHHVSPVLHDLRGASKVMSPAHSARESRFQVDPKPS